MKMNNATLVRVNAPVCAPHRQSTAMNSALADQSCHHQSLCARIISMKPTLSQAIIRTNQRKSKHPE